MWIWMGLLLRQNYLLGCWGCLSLLNWIGALTLFPLLKLPPRKFEPWFVLWSFFFMKLLFIKPRMEYRCVSTGAPSFYLDMGYMLDKQLCRIFGPLLAATWVIVEMWPAQVFSIVITLVDVHQNWLIWFRFLILEENPTVIPIDWVIFPSPLLNLIKISLLTVSFIILLEFSAYRMLSFDLWCK